MKTLLSLFLLTSILCFSCSDKVGEKEGPVVVFNNDTLQVDENVGDHELAVSAFFQSPDGSPLGIEIVENTNSTIVDVDYTEGQLTFKVKPNVFGTSQIEIKASTNGKSASVRFILFVKGSTGSVAFTEGTSAFQSGAWAKAKEHFSSALNDNRYKESAYTGLGYALIYLGEEESAYQQLTEGYRSMPRSAQVRSGLVFLEHFSKENHTNAIEHGKAILPTDASTFSMVWDSNVNEKDIRFVMAKSYVDLSDYENAAKQLKLIDGFSGTTKNAILEKLAELANTLK